MGCARWELVQNLVTAATRPWGTDRLFRCDPYLVWSDAVTAPSEAGYGFDFPVLIELKLKSDLPDFLKQSIRNASDLAERLFIPNGFEPLAGSRFITGRVNRQGLDALVSELAKPEAERKIERFSLQDSRVGSGDKAGNRWKAYLEDKAAFRKAAAQPIGTGTESKLPKPPPAEEAGTYLGIVDDGLPALRIRRAARSCGLPAHFWDQGWRPPQSMGGEVCAPPKDDPDWNVGWSFRPAVRLDADVAVRGFLYGRQLGPLPGDTASPPPGDASEYARARYFNPPPRQSHGAAVLGLMAPWLSEARGPIDWPAHISGLAMVQLPTPTVMDTSGGSLAMRVLDGLRYILWQEESDRLGTQGPRPVVANVSYGVHAGPHDGTSMFERAVLEMLERNPRLHLILPAGNAAQAGCHAQRKLSGRDEANASAVFMLEVLPDNSRDVFVEIWLPRDAGVSFGIRPPGSEEVYSIIEGEARIHFEPDPSDPRKPRTVHFGAVYSASVAQGTTGTMILLAIGSTMRSGPAELAPGRTDPRRRLEVAGHSGVWELTVRNLKAGDITVDAWVERGDAAPDAPGGSRQAYFPDALQKQAGNSTPEGTLNGIATMKHDRLHVVGAMCEDGTLSDYSAAGPARSPGERQGPDVVVTADANTSLPGIRTTGFLRGVVGRINGTSAACAVFARFRARELGLPFRKRGKPEPPPAKPGPMRPLPNGRPRADPAHRGEAERRTFPLEVDPEVPKPQR